MRRYVFLDVQPRLVLLPDSPFRSAQVIFYDVTVTHDISTTARFRFCGLIRLRFTGVAVWRRVLAADWIDRRLL